MNAMWRKDPAANAVIQLAILSFSDRPAPKNSPTKAPPIDNKLRMVTGIIPIPKQLNYPRT